jgi:signal recognition particle receptor subunit beta
LIDTPGQIEVFTWSASGQIISYALASTGPTAILFVLDSYRCQNPNTFMSNMLFCCSILYKLKLPILVVFNKSDVADPQVPIGWMKDYDSFIDVIKGSENYLSTLSRSMA